MGKNKELFFDHQQEQRFMAQEYYDTIPELPSPVTSAPKTEAGELLEFMGDCLKAMQAMENLINEVDSGQYHDTVFNSVGYRDALIVNYQHAAAMHANALKEYIKVTTKITDAKRFYHPSSHAA